MWCSDCDSLGPLFGFAGFLDDFRGIYHPGGFDSILGAFLGVCVEKESHPDLRGWDGDTPNIQIQIMRSIGCGSGLVG